MMMYVACSKSLCVTVSLIPVEKNSFFYFMKCCSLLHTHNAGVVVVNSKVVGLAPIGADPTTSGKSVSTKKQKIILFQNAPGYVRVLSAEIFTTLAL
jgi:hypothetical protein